MDVAPAPALGVGAEAVAEVVEGAAERFQHELVPGAADQLLVALLPEVHQVRVPAPGRGDVRGEAVVGAVEPALAEVAVADRGAGDLARQPQQEGLVDRAGDRVGVEPPVPAAQALDRAALALALRRQPAEPPRRLESRESRGCRTASPRSPRCRARRSRAAVPRSAAARKPSSQSLVMWCGYSSPTMRLLAVIRKPLSGSTTSGSSVVGDRPLPLELAGPARLRQVGAAALAQRQAADQLVADRAVAVGPDQVRGGRGVALELGDQLGAGARSRAARTSP